MTQGKCDSCRKVYEWDGRPLVRDALCPTCKQPLARTTHMLGVSRSSRDSGWNRVVETPYEIVR